MSCMLQGYKVTLDFNGGESPSTTETTIDIFSLNSKSIPYDLVKEGNYKFRGWSYNDEQILDEKGNIIGNPKLDSEMTFVAIFDDKLILDIVYSLYNSSGDLIQEYDDCEQFGDIFKTTKCDWNSEVNLYATVNDGYKFVGWYSDGYAISTSAAYKYAMIDEDVTLEARFTYSDYTLDVTVNDASLGGVLLSNGDNQNYLDHITSSICYLDSVKLIARTTTGVKFLGWFDENDKLLTLNPIYTFTMPNKDYNIQAKWGLYSINYDLDGGINDLDNPDQFHAENDAIVLKAPAKEGYNFEGWYLGNTKVTQIDTSIDSDITLVAHWSFETVSTTNSNPDAGEISVYSAQKFSEGASVTVNASSYIMFNFDGWYLSGSKVSDAQSYTFDMPKETLSLEARWTMRTDLDDFICSYTHTEITIESAKNKALTDVVLPSGVVAIGNKAFSEMRSLRSVTLPNTLRTIGDQAFSDCIGLKNINFPNSLTYIGLNAFACCIALKELEIPSSLNEMGEYPFVYCMSLESITVDPNNTHYDSRNNCNALIETATNILLVGTKTTTIPQGIERIGDGAFISNFGIVSIDIPSSVQYIDELAFMGCSNLQSVTLHNGLIEIGDGAFEMCYNLTSIEIPSTVHTIVDGAFNECYKLAEVVNLSSYLTITKGSDSNGKVAYYAKDVYTNTSYTSKISTDSNGFVTYNDGVDIHLINYVGSNGAITIPSSVTVIDSNAFFANYDVYSVTIPATITTISNDAFKECTNIVEVVNLSSLDIQKGASTFGGIAKNALDVFISTPYDSKLTIYDTDFVVYEDNDEKILVSYLGNSSNVVVPEGITRFYGLVFAYNLEIDTLSLPNSMVYSSQYDFDFLGCSFNVYEGGLYLGNSSNPYLVLVTTANNIETLNVHENCKIIAANAIPYDAQETLTTVVIPNSVEYIWDSAFSSCSNLQSITFGTGLKEIGDHAFFGCSSLEYIDLSMTQLTRLGDGAFYACSSLEEVVFPDSVTYIGMTAFQDATNLARVNIPASLEGTGHCAFTRTAVEEIVFPEGIEVISQQMFWYCQSLTTITIPSTVTEIELSAFAYDIALENIYYSGTVEQWGLVTKGSNWIGYGVPATKVICSNGTVNL